MDADDFIKNLNNALEKTANDMLPTMEEAALTAKGMLTRRVIEKGFGAHYRNGSYKKLRDAKGYEIRFVNLKFTGEMIGGWIIPVSYREGLKVGAGMKGNTETVIKKLRWNKSRYPTFDKIDETEKQILNDFVTVRLAEAFKNNLLNP